MARSYGGRSDAFRRVHRAGDSRFLRRPRDRGESASRKRTAAGKVASSTREERFELGNRPPEPKRDLRDAAATRPSALRAIDSLGTPVRRVNSARAAIFSASRSSCSSLSPGSPATSWAAFGLECAGSTWRRHHSRCSAGRRRSRCRCSQRRGRRSCRHPDFTFARPPPQPSPASAAACDRQRS